MKKKYLKPYGIDVEYEQKTYKHVAKDYWDSKNSNLGLLLNIKSFCRKKQNRKCDKYAFCNTYTEWENHVKKIISYDISNKNDLIHWLYQKRNEKNQLFEAVKQC